MIPRWSSRATVPGGWAPARTAPHRTAGTVRRDRACREHGTFKVRWRSGRRWSPSFRYPAGNLITVERIGRKWGRAKLPKLGWVRFRWSRPLGGEVRSATVSRQGRHWFVSFLVDDGRTTPEQHSMPATAVGIDRGVKVAATTSDGVFHDRPFATAGEAARHRRLQQKLSRQKRGSRRRKQTRPSDDDTRLLDRLAHEGRVAGPGSPSRPGVRRVDADIAGLLSGTYPRSIAPTDRVVVNPFGMGVHDIAIAIAERMQAAALDHATGTWLPR